ncbi:MAG: ribosomal L7Ae/L30e/S12e/Gadd45 family protein [candidate division KSB1 bacterium]|nr:ribosomal L7Ae/L30e/S12e/Gadd45 family protein [candidate division KSB1 bacterium]MDZ7273278.1 ribosomal L7Ae/L30e/S12e/Gadd45 family protein [candidate division KSB1 bacterium]MDZ7285380.1 ribosomal L7Ae/L30e/S12e/Gadd45 family protein [candidate division KSB1 bacterium]MDZ7298412.1 ribosomal L7Ae/L30e/S12e/Gadd45 family protein [candidate division KSB1 bacterium]MDZ7307677.1 ribosomal L7Ae/L30e/S12e/Gadd45 family protein [candidate division KSB1 bacterium]
MLPDDILPLLGLAQRAGKIVIGFDAVRRAINTRQAVLVVFAGDAAAARRRVLHHTVAVPHVIVGTKAEWGRYWGRSEVAMFALLDRNFAKGILARLKEQPA